MALDAIAPGAFGGRGAEDGEEVIIGVAPIGRPGAFEEQQNLFEAHDGLSLDDALLAESGGKQSGRQFALKGLHGAKGHTLAEFAVARLIVRSGRHKVPGEAFVVVEGVGGLGLLVGPE